MTPTKLEHMCSGLLWQWLIQGPMQLVFLALAYRWPVGWHVSVVNETGLGWAALCLALWVVALRRRRARREMVALALATGTLTLYEVHYTDYKWARRIAKRLLADKLIVS